MPSQAPYFGYTNNEAAAKQEEHKKPCRNAYRWTHKINGTDYNCGDLTENEDYCVPFSSTLMYNLDYHQACCDCDKGGYIQIQNVACQYDYRLAKILVDLKNYYFFFFNFVMIPVMVGPSDTLGVF